MSFIHGKSYGEITCSFIVRPCCPKCMIEHDCKSFDSLDKALYFLETNTRLCYDCEEDIK